MTSISTLEDNTDTVSVWSYDSDEGYHAEKERQESKAKAKAIASGKTIIGTYSTKISNRRAKRIKAKIAKRSRRRNR